MIKDQLEALYEEQKKQQLAEEAERIRKLKEEQVTLPQLHSSLVCAACLPHSYVHLLFVLRACPTATFISCLCCVPAGIAAASMHHGVTRLYCVPGGIAAASMHHGVTRLCCVPGGIAVARTDGAVRLAWSHILRVKPCDSECFIFILMRTS